jgi:spoIIIJ-associated protein
LVPATSEGDASDEPSNASEPSNTGQVGSGGGPDTPNGTDVVDPEPPAEAADEDAEPNAVAPDDDDSGEDSGEDSAEEAHGDSPDHADADSAGEPDEARGRSRRGGAARLEREGEIAADFLERLLDIADLDGDLDVDVEGERASVAIVDSPEGRVPRRLVGQNGEVLEALQELTRLAVQARTGDRSRLMLDVAGHRAHRREQLVERAQEAIGQVRDSGEPLRLEAMNPFERKIVHDAVAAAGLSSSSEGVEPDRRIVVRPGD